MAHKKGAGSSDNGRDSAPKYLGVKMFGGQHAIPGNILIRQRGTKFHPGRNTYMGKDHTIHAQVEGVVLFKRGKDDRTFVHIVPSEAALAEGLATRTAALSKLVSKAAAIADGTFVEKVKVVVEAPVKPVKVSKKQAAAAAEAAELTVAPVVVEKVVASPAVAPKAAPAPVVIEEAVPVVIEEAAPVVIEEAAPVVIEEAAPVVIEEAAPEIILEAAPAAKDDLKVIEGIGPKIAELFNAEGIYTFRQLSETSVERMKEILEAAGSRYATHNPGTWGQQAELAADGKMDELKELQDRLDGGKE